MLTILTLSTLMPETTALETQPLCLSIRNCIIPACGVVAILYYRSKTTVDGRLSFQVPALACHGGYLLSFTDDLSIGTIALRMR
jgi:hypothetical protein